MAARLKILIACEYSGRVRDAFTALGHDAMSCDLLPSETPGKHYQGDVRHLFKKNFDMLIGFPPCTDLAVSGAPHFEVKRNDGRQQKAISFFMDIVNAPYPRIAVENPVGIMSGIYRRPDQIIQPYYFGDNVPKKTCLWLTGLPKLTYSLTDNLFEQKTAVEPEYLIYNSKKTKSGKSKYSILGGLGKGHGKERSITFPGIAQAMAAQWGGLQPLNTTT